MPLKREHFLASTMLVDDWISGDMYNDIAASLGTSGAPECAYAYAQLSAVSKAMPEVQLNNTQHRYRQKGSSATTFSNNTSNRVVVQAVQQNPNNNNNNTRHQRSMESRLQNQSIMPNVFRTPPPSVHAMLPPPVPTSPTTASTNFHSAKSGIGPGTTFHEPSTQSQPGRIPPGMREVPIWLKSLRLHKYTQLFQELTYEEMLGLDEITLESCNVTKGARRKIMQSIEKLKQRPELLRETEHMLHYSRQRCLNCAIAVLRHMLSTPIRPYVRKEEEKEELNDAVLLCNISDENIPAMICRVLCVVHALVFGNSSLTGDVDDEYLLMLLSVYDKILSNEAFTSAQKQRVITWKRIARKYTPSDLKRQRVVTPHTGKCDSCQKDTMRQDSPRHNARWRPTSTGSAPTEFDIQKILAQALLSPQFSPELVFALKLILQQHQEQQVQRCNQYSGIYQTCSQQSRIGQKQQADENVAHPLFGPQPENLISRFASQVSQRQKELQLDQMVKQQRERQQILLLQQQHQLMSLCTATSSPSTESVYSSSQTSPASPLSPPIARLYAPMQSQQRTTQSAAPLSPTHLPTDIYHSKDVLSLCGSGGDFALNKSVEAMNIGMWNGAKQEGTEPVTRGPFDVFQTRQPSAQYPCGDATSGYSSGGSERGSGAGSPGSSGLYGGDRAAPAVHNFSDHLYKTVHEMFQPTASNWPFEFFGKSTAGNSNV